ncbi:MAG TPA: LytR C-terminal domain-containing protein [Candidatus Bathyarchaeia archaeon]|nr:LytR C-terminal domain-containing protein [Candidatus Bathyarchaeia archaeon]
MKKRLPKKKKKAFLPRFLVLLISSCFLLFLFWKVYGALSESVWDGEHQLNIVFDSRPTVVASFSPAQDKLVLLLVPDKTFVETAHGYGQYRLEAIWELGKLENRPALLAESCQGGLGLVIDGFVGDQRENLVLPTSGEGQEKQVQKKLLGTFFQLVKKRKATNLTRWDLVRLFWQMGKVRFDKVSLIDLGQTSALLPTTLPDGSSGFKIDQNRLDTILARFFQDEKIITEGISLEVVNATDHFGLAAQGARLVANLGGRVISLKDSQEKKSQCQIKSLKEEKDSYTLKRLAKVFGCRSETGSLGDSRAEAVLILGNNYWQRLNEK